MTTKAYSRHDQAALALLASGVKLSRKEGGFLGQIAVDPRPLSEKQDHWLAQLLERAGLPPFTREDNS